MLLTEIKRTPIKPKSAKHRFIPQNLWDRFKYIGHGIGSGIDPSEVFLDLKHPNRILKVVAIADLNDSYYRYLRMIEKHQNNPYFPKVYGIKVYDLEEEDGIYYLYAFMEKLLPMSSLPQEQVHYLLNSIGIPYTGKVKQDYSLRQQFKEPQERKAIRTETPDANLIKALRLMEPMFNKFGSDIHIENIMLRVGPSKHPQVVIVDPFFPSNL